MSPLATATKHVSAPDANTPRKQASNTNGVNGETSLIGLFTKGTYVAAAALKKLKKNHIKQMMTIGLDTVARELDMAGVCIRPIHYQHTLLHFDRAVQPAVFFCPEKNHLGVALGNEAS